MEVIIEEISRGQKVLGRSKFSKPSITIGRSYKNDIVFADPHVCPEHIQINIEDNDWVLTDNNSVNGSYISDSKDNADKHILRSGDIISFGKSQIRIVFPDHPVEPSITLSPFESVVDITRTPLILFSNILFFTFLTGYLFYLNKPLEVSFSQLLVPAIGMTLAFALWPLAISLISHLTKHDARTLSQLGICFAFFNLMWLSDVIEKVVDVNLSSNWPLTGIITLLPIGLAFCLFWLNSYIGFHMTEKRRFIVAICLTTLLFGGSFLIKLSNKPEFSPRPHYNSNIMPPIFILSPSVTVEEFIEDNQRLFEQVEKDFEKDAEEND
jgi:hypothetical protein